jgi:hypothetical protein
VLEGCLWLTRPGDESDRFLHAGSSIELHEDLVLIESDWDPAHTSVPAARYRLEPLTQAQSSTPVARSALLRLLAWMPLRPRYPRPRRAISFNTDLAQAATLRPFVTKRVGVCSRYGFPWCSLPWSVALPRGRST